MLLNIWGIVVHVIYIDSKNMTFCKMIESRLQKQIKKLKDDNKI
jgi:hypothetical protein